ncbi:hypothetical protein ABK040_004125 [Willaertia magna]
MATFTFDKSFIERPDGMPIIIFEHPSMTMEGFIKELNNSSTKNKKKKFKSLTLYLPGLGKIMFNQSTISYKVYKQPLNKDFITIYNWSKLNLCFDKTKPNYTLFFKETNWCLFFERTREVNQQFLLFKLRKYYRYLELENDKGDWLWDLPLETRSTIISFFNVKEMVNCVSLISKSFYVATYIYLLRDFTGFGHISDIPILF